MSFHPSFFRPGTTWAQQAAFAGTPEHGCNSKVALGGAHGVQLNPHLTMDPRSLPTVLVSSSEVRWEEEFSSRPKGGVLNRLHAEVLMASCLPQHSRFLQCSTCLSHSHSPMPCTATFSPPRQVMGTPHAGAQFHASYLPPFPFSIHFTLLPA